MQNNKILTIAVIVLLLSNIGLVAFMLMGKSRKDDKRHGGRRESFEMMVKVLEMTEQQQADYKRMKEEHMKKVRPFYDSIKAAKSAFFALTKDSTVTDSLINLYGLRITERQWLLDKITFTHFRNVRKLFTPGQQLKFDSFMQRMMQRGRRDSSAKNR
jgi:hypothetical protein